MVSVNRRTLYVIAGLNIGFLLLSWYYLSSSSVGTPTYSQPRRHCNIYTKPTVNGSKISATGKRYLLILDNWYREQLTQMQVVVAQLMLLAKELNRTAVLPPVAKSHLWWPSAVSNHPGMRDGYLLRFSEYFTVNASAAGLDPADVIDMEDYLTITGMNREAVSLYALCWNSKCGPDFRIVEDCKSQAFPDDMLTLWATGETMKNDGLIQTAGYWRVLRRMCFTFKPGDKPHVVEWIARDYPDVDVAFSYYHKHIFPIESVNTNPFFSPSAVLLAEADRFVDEVLAGGNFAAVQWRMEKTHISWFRHLMPAVIKVIHAALDKNHFPVVFLGTEFATNASDSWKPGEMKSKRQWYNYLLTELRSKYKVIEGYADTRFSDTGQVAIVDRLVAIKSKLLIPIEMASSYAKAIVKDHELEGGETDRSIYWVYENQWVATDQSAINIEKRAPAMEELPEG